VGLLGNLDLAFFFCEAGGGGLARPIGPFRPPCIGCGLDGRAAGWGFDGELREGDSVVVVERCSAAVSGTSAELGGGVRISVEGAACSSKAVGDVVALVGGAALLPSPLDSGGNSISDGPSPSPPPSSSTGADPFATSNLSNSPLRSPSSSSLSSHPFPLASRRFSLRFSFFTCAFVFPPPPSV